MEDEVQTLILKSVLALVFTVGISAASYAVENIRVMALFPDKAMVQVDGKNRLLKKGKASPEGLLLISADSKEAVIEFNGERKSYQVGARYGGSFNKSSKREVRITRDNRGSYNTVGSINGRNVDMLVDTGATSVAMSSVEAKRLGLQYWLDGKRTTVATASGYARGYVITLKKVQVGPIGLNNVEAVVVEGSSPHTVLLGMSFLNRVDIENSGNVMLLRAKF